ncbi:universal stress protein [Geodermatophilus sp. TF02-6]|uniref:universal stress protein n=1 Tax=Geodermatophilus sp. TF02-6 TaxID=2250575 RepID=UPI000DE8DD66|nr:universal stress protein [Geodermatophilus sp. TF02-6]RBY83758.1 universal stress protein [Geodermatophilus sp. TF02-6]
MSIVLGYDESPGSRPALAMAISLAERYEEPLVLVYGVEPPGGVGEEFQAHQRALAELGRTAVAHAVGEAEQAGVATVVEVLSEKPAQALVDAAHRHDGRVIVVGTRGESPLRGAFLGSVSHKMLHLSDRPVLCVPVGGEDH